MKSNKLNNVFCPKCKKPIYSTECIACKGKTYQRHLFVFKRLCERCKGIGKEYYCSAWWSHYEDNERERRHHLIEEYIRSYGQSAAT